MKLVEMVPDKDNLRSFKSRYSFNESVVSHQLFVKKHSVHKQSEDKPADRTLFVANVPPWMTQNHLKTSLSINAGIVQSVILLNTLKNDEPPPTDNGFKFAFIVFKKSVSLQKALSLGDTVLYFKIDTCDSFNINSWILEYNKSMIEQELLQIKVKNVIEEYDREEAKRAKSKEVTDNEGWTLVSKKDRNPGGSRTESSWNKSHERLKKKEKGLKNFYTFQIKESKMNEIAMLRKKHEEDKKKIEAIKKSRKFKPY